MESIRKSPKCYFSSLLLPFFLYFTWIQFLRNVFQRHLLLKADYYLWRKHFAKQRVCNYRLLLINLQSPNRHPVQISKGWNGHHSSSTYPSEPKKLRVVSYKELLRGLGSRDNNFFWWLIKKSILICLVIFWFKNVMERGIRKFVTFVIRYIAPKIFWKIILKPLYFRKDSSSPRMTEHIQIL